MLCRVRINKYEPFWDAQRADLLQRTGLPPNITNCPEQPEAGITNPAASTRIAVGVALGSACLAAVVSAAVVVIRRRARKGLRHPMGQLLPGSHPASEAQLKLGTPALTSSKHAVQFASRQACAAAGDSSMLGSEASKGLGFPSSPFAMALYGHSESSVLADMSAGSNPHTGSEGQPLSSGSRSARGAKQGAQFRSGDSCLVLWRTCCMRAPAQKTKGDR